VVPPPRRVLSGEGQHVLSEEREESRPPPLPSSRCSRERQRRLLSVRARGVYTYARACRGGEGSSQEERMGSRRLRHHHHHHHGRWVVPSVAPAAAAFAAAGLLLVVVAFHCFLSPPLGDGGDRAVIRRPNPPFLVRFL
jgi:hypothetical protein